MSRALYTLEQAAPELGITHDDVADPPRLVLAYVLYSVGGWVFS